MKNFKKQLKQGDIIMYHTHGFVSNIIRKFDQSNYNHCSIYDTDGFLYEAVSGGVQRKTIEESIKKQGTSLITIFRVKNIDESKTHLIIDYVKTVYNNKFAYSQIVLIAAILWKRKKKLKGLLSYLANFVFLVYEKIIFWFIDKGDDNMACSELVYRAYMDIAKKHKDARFVIHIPLECSPIFIFENENMKKLHPCELERYDENNTSIISQASDKNNGLIQVEKIQAYLSDLFSTEKYHMLSFTKYTPLESKTDILARKARKVARILKRAELYNFITPGDIARSLDTYTVATYKTDLISNFTDCPVCKN